ncbi:MULTISPECIES: bifunctional UDP-sugar hydrolase/5'-nucleotidase [Corallococcus]|uniref:bifunctional metallophosphatase/5'-nucleotidase n=1 Tax=Corallococcus TaxID=83461 RepID=UPI00117D96D6|nr:MULTISPECIES: bifunctional UDP-sugar hydrolase/5'-nucleotidase [Corallococcus]NBD11759.1 bifunctional metallophosphatase/5'-nucleotidase [Corallococcus silvisoli]TSC23588.1 bifunctional metallophosphatase/5'-nucleotidase [Corallococcus sp. Z5C101001]
MMKKTVSTWAVLLPLALVLATRASGADSPTPPADTVRLTILHLNDVYQFQPTAQNRGGLSRVATLRQQALKESPHVLTLLAGDTLSPSVESSAEVAGEALKGKQMIDAWNALGLDYSTVGNHEFDFGDDVLRARIHQSRFPWLGANVLSKKSGQVFDGLKAWDLRDVGGVKVGLFGVVLPETQNSSKPGKDTRITPFCEAAKRSVDELRAAGAQLVVGLTHLSVEQDRELAKCVRVDLIIGGHDHDRVEETVAGTPIFKLDEDAIDLGRLTLDLDAKTGAVKKLAWKVIPITSKVPNDAAFDEQMKPYAPLLATLAEGIGRSPVALDARSAQNRLGETNLGSFLADAFREATGAEVALVNGGAVRADRVLPAGRMTRRELYSLMPYRNELVVLDVKGATLRAALENGVSLNSVDGKPPGRFPQVSGLRFTYDLRKAPGERVTKVEVKGRPLDDAAVYRLATLSFVAAGNDGYTMLKDVPLLPMSKDIPSPWDVLSRAFSTGKPAPRAKPQGRIALVGAPPGGVHVTPSMK